MADTIRTLASLQALLADNITGDISPQDARDFLVSALGVYAEVYTHGGATGVAVGTSPVVVPFESDGLENGLDADQANDRITVVSGAEGVLLVAGQFSFTGTADAIFTLRLTKNTVAQNALVCSRKMDAAGAIGSCSFAGLVSVAAADYLEVTVEADAAGKTFTPVHIQLTARRVA